MIDEVRVVPKCYGDTLFINMLLRTKVNHIKTNSNVAKYLARCIDENKNIVAITDDDKNKPEKLKEIIQMLINIHDDDFLDAYESR